MRKTILLLLAALSLASCRVQEEAERPLAGDKSILFHALTETPTRTSFGPKENGTYPAYWTANDTRVKLALNYSEARDADVSPSADGLKASFVAVLNPEATTAPYVFNALSPASAVSSLSPSRKAWSIDIPASQTPLEGSVDEAAMLLWARSEETQVLPDEMNLTFHHLTAYGVLSLKNLDTGGAPVQRVEITSTTPLAGSWYFGCEDGALQENGASSTLTLYTSSTEDIWFACAPVDVSGEILMFSVYTTDGVYVTEVEMPQGRSFKSGTVARMSVDFTGVAPAEGGSDAFVLVTNTSELQDGDQILILNVDETYALSTNQKSYNRGAVAVSVEDHTLPAIASDVQVITLKKESAGVWNLHVGSGYLANSSTAANRLLTIASITDNARWSISVASSGVATIEAGAGARNLLRYNPNNGAPLFSCYEKGQEEVVIYRKGEAGTLPSEEDPLTAESAFGYYFGDTRSYQPGTDQYSREYDAEGNLLFTLLNPVETEQVEISGYRLSLLKGDETVISVTHRRGRAQIFQESRKLTVVKEDGAKVWLGDGSGNGVIIKK